MLIITASCFPVIIDPNAKLQWHWGESYGYYLKDTHLGMSIADVLEIPTKLVIKSKKNITLAQTKYSSFLAPNLNNKFYDKQLLRKNCLDFENALEQGYCFTNVTTPDDQTLYLEFAWWRSQWSLYILLNHH